MTPAASAPKPPQRPSQDECCGRGCEPCIFDYYERALTRWLDKVQAMGLDPATLMREAAGR